jgi:putative hydrolase of the HAD superfamily
MTTAVCFDLDGTVTQLTKPYDSLLAGTFETCLGHSNSAWEAYYSERFFHYFESVEAEPYQRAMADVCDNFDLSADPRELANEQLEREFAASVVNDGVRDVLTTLSSHHPLGIITNGVGHVQREKLARTDHDGLFDAVVVSYDVGAHKPDKSIFDAARDRLDADRYVMVGDDYDADIVGAREAGFETVHLQSDDEKANVTISDISALGLLSDLNVNRSR